MRDELMHALDRQEEIDRLMHLREKGHEQCLNAAADADLAGNIEFRDHCLNRDREFIGLMDGLVDRLFGGKQ